MSITVTLESRDIAVILAALRYWQRVPDDTHLPPEIIDIWHGSGDFTPMSDRDIDTLCERINGTAPDAPLSHETLKHGEYLVEYECQEQVTYRRSLVVDGAILIGDDELREFCEQDWVENGHPIKDFCAVEERDYDRLYVTGQDGKRLSAEVFFSSR